jgi:peptide/nickel transport system permease protein
VLAYLGRRLLYSIPVVAGVTVASFVLIHLVPGDPARRMLGFSATDENLARVREDLGLDRSLPEELWRFVERAVTGDFGESFFKQAPVLEVIGNAALPSLWLILYAVAISLAVAVPLAVLSALRRNRLADHAVRVATMVTFAMPSFWVGLLLVLCFSLWLGWFPVSGYREGVGGVLHSLTLPAVTVGLFLAPIVVRTLRASLLEALASDYVEAARARGLSELRVVGRGALRNALVATLTVLSINVGYLIGGTVVVENVFQIPGVGTLLVQSILDRDYPLIRALALFFGIAVVLVNLLTDLGYALIDPRVRLGARS